MKGRFQAEIAAGRLTWGVVRNPEGSTDAMLTLRITLNDGGANNTTVVTSELLLNQFCEVVRNRERVMATTWRTYDTSVISSSRLSDAITHFAGVYTDKFLSDWLAANPRR